MGYILTFEQTVRNCQLRKSVIFKETERKWHIQRCEFAVLPVALFPALQFK